MSVQFVSAFLSWAACASAARFTSRKAMLCVGSEETCDGNTCCPGYSESYGQSFPCINADDSFDECDVNIKYGMYNASLLDFSNVVFDKISSDTDRSGEALIGGAGWWGGQRVDLLIQYVDEQDNVVPVQEKVFKALKPEETGYLLRFDFQKMSSGRFRFNYGQWEDGVWRPFEMPWATVTLMDIDCGRKTGRDEDCEVITSADHSTYEAGGNVAVTSGEDGAVSFKDTIVSGAENNPDDIILNMEQKALAVALYLRDTDHFTLDMRNDAPWPRTFLVAGITNIQWPNMNPPPIKLIPETVPPTPWPTPAPVATLLPTPSPTSTCSFTAVSGSCVVNCTCVSSSNYPQNYAANDACVIGVASPTPLITKDFSTEAFWDALEVNGESFSGSDGPDGLVAEGTISWKADKQDQDKGWQICASIPETAPIPAPPTPTITVQTTEPCESSGALCVQSPNYPLNYGDYQTCSIRLPAGTLHVDEFFTEKLYDTLTVDGVSFSGRSSPDKVEVSASSVIVWSSDWGTTHTGWRMCAEPPAPTPAPTEELLDRPRSVPLTLSRVTNEHPWLLMLSGITGIVGGLGILGCVLRWCGGIVSHAEEDSSSSDDSPQSN